MLDVAQLIGRHRMDMRSCFKQMWEDKCTWEKQSIHSQAYAICPPGPAHHCKSHSQRALLCFIVHTSELRVNIQLLGWNHDPVYHLKGAVCEPSYGHYLSWLALLVYPLLPRNWSLTDRLLSYTLQTTRARRTPA